MKVNCRTHHKLEQEKVFQSSWVAAAELCDLRNHGVLPVGKGVEDAWFLMFNLVLACRTQCAAMKCVGQEGLHVPSDDAQAAAAPVARKMCAEGFGVREFAAEVRLLEREGASFRA